MELIDSQGRLFGAVNVVDALVVLVVVAVGLAGAVLVFGGGGASGGGPELATTTVTLDLGTHPDAVAGALRVGDSFSPGTQSNLTVTDVYLAPQDNATRAIVRAEITGRLQGEAETVTYNGGPLRLGRSLTLTGDRYEVSGRIAAVGDDASFGQRTVVVRSRVSAETARELTPGAESSIAGRTVATLRSVSVYGTDDPDEKLVYAGLAVDTYTTGGVARFGETPLREGNGLLFRTDEYGLHGEIVRLNATEQRGTERRRTVTLALRDLSPQRAATISAGMAERANGQVVAEIVGVERSPSQVVVTDQSGQLLVRDHPVTVDLRLRTELTVRETSEGVRFKGRTIQHGSNVTLALDGVTIEPTVVSL